jgi:outer membrane protein
MKKIFLTLYNSLFISILFAQNLSLPEAIEQGMSNRWELKAQNLQLKIDQNENAKIDAAWQPQLNASGDIRYNAILQKSVIPIGKFGLPNTASDATSTVAFGVPFTASLGVEATQKLYDANKAIDKKVNANRAEYQANNIEHQKNEARYAIAEAYYSAIFQKEKINFATQALARANGNLETTETRLKLGIALKNDVDKLILEVSNAQLTARKAQQDYEFALTQLKYQMQIPQSTKIDLSEKIQSLLSAIIPENTAAPLTNAIKAEEIARSGNDLQIEKLTKSNSPKVSAYGNFSLLALNTNISPYSYLGVRATMPLYDGKLAKITIEDYKIRQQINQINIDKLKSDIDFQIQSAQKAIEQAQLDLEASKKNITLAQQIYETDKFRLAQGNILPNDLKNSEYALQNAENNYLTIAYNVLVANLRLKKLIEKW